MGGADDVHAATLIQTERIIKCGIEVAMPYRIQGVRKLSGAALRTYDRRWVYSPYRRTIGQNA